MPVENITNPLFIAAYFGAIIIISAAIAFAIIKFEKWQSKKLIDQINIKSKNDIAAYRKSHADFMRALKRKTAASDAKLASIVNSPKYQKMRREINSEHAAMIKAKQQFKDIYKA